jgi:hypothetical protein
MSEERRKRKQAREPKPKQESSTAKKIIIALAILAAFGLAVYLGFRKRTSRLDAFAKCTAQEGAKMYGAYWCPHCEEQKEVFGSAFQYVNYVECGIKGNPKGQTQACIDAGIKHYPTWQFANASRVEGKEDLLFLSQKTGCSLP